MYRSLLDMEAVQVAPNCVRLQLVAVLNPSLADATEIAFLRSRQGSAALASVEKGVASAL